MRSKNVLEHHLCPNHLLLGRTNQQPAYKQPTVFTATKAKMYKFTQELKQQFFDRIITYHCHSLFPQYQWTKLRPNLDIGDVVLLKQDSKLAKTWKLGVTK